MASEKRTLESAEGVTLLEVSLRNGGTVVAMAYVVKTLRTPETWNFEDESQARKRYNEEVQMCRSDEFVQRRLGG